MSSSLRPHGLHHASPPCPLPTPGVYLNSCPWSQRCHPTISSSVFPSPPALNLSQHQGLFKWVSSSHQVAKVLEFQLQHQSFQRTFKTDFLQDWPVWCPCSPRDSQYSHATAAKSLQSCPTLCDPIDGSLPDSPVPGTLQARTLEWGAIAFSAHKWP